MSRVPVWLIGWMIVMAAALLWRPPLPVDETRYLAVAWEMWLRGDFIVPYLNGEPYHHKPPLLFWLMTAGWSVFGVNDWWPKLVAPLFAVVAMWWTGRIALQLWPNDRNTALLAPVVLVGAAFWAIFQSLTMFDMMLAACTVVGIGGVVRAWRDGGMSGWLIAGVAIGVGVLAKGPAILLHILPVAILAPWWGPALIGAPDRPMVSWTSWYLRLGVAVFIGAAIGLAWAIPAGIQGGEAYRDMIFWGQSAGRIVKSFDHARPFWWYAAVLPPLLLPWLIWPRLWRGLRNCFAISDGGTRLLIAWVAPAFVVFSLISGKQLHYLLPEFAAFALLFARVLTNDDVKEPKPYDPVLIIGFFLCLAGIALALPLFQDQIRKPLWFQDVDGLPGGLLILSALIVWLCRKKPLSHAVAMISLSMMLLVVCVHLTLKDALAKVYDLRPIATHLKSFEDQGLPLANFGYYHGQYQFLGRLQQPMAVLGQDHDTTTDYIANTDQGVVVAYYYEKHLDRLPADVTPLARYRFRDFQVYFWPIEAFKRYPNIGDR